MKEIDGSTTTLYINRYYEKNVTTSEVTTHYYLGGKQIAVRKGSTVSYLLQDHLGSTSVTASTAGASTSTVRYLAFGLTRSTTGTIPTDKQFTGQRLDSTGLYYYNARYYDPEIGRFISPDTIVPNPANPQSLNRYSYCLNNPLKYVDPSGMRYEYSYPWGDMDWETAESIGIVNPETAYWDIMFSADVPPWIKSYMQTLHDSDRVISVEFGNYGGEGAGISAMQILYEGIIPVYTTSDMIKIDSSYLSDGPGLASMLAHESYHIFEANPGATIQEEFTAYSAQYFVGRSLGWDYVTNGHMDWLWKPGGGLGSNQFLGGIRSQLRGGQGNSANVYGAMPFRQSQMNTTYLVRQGIYAANLPGPGWLSTGLGYTLGYGLRGDLSARGIPWE